MLNPGPHQPLEGTIVGFTHGRNPFVKVKEDGFVETRRIPKNLELVCEMELETQEIVSESVISHFDREEQEGKSSVQLEQ